MNAIVFFIFGLLLFIPVISGASETSRLQDIINILQFSPTARTLLAKAQMQNPHWQEQVILDQIAYTKSTIIRRLLANGEVVVEEKRVLALALNKEITNQEAVLSLVHELTHFVERPFFNPYQEHDFNLENFIRYNIEGDGGEFIAYKNECLVLQELFGTSASVAHRAYCPLILQGERKEFYKLGAYEQEFRRLVAKYNIQQLLKEINSEGPSFVSAVHSLPYPLALLRQYEELLAMMCANDERRLRSLHAEVDSTASKRQQEIKEIENRYFGRCVGQSL